MADEYLVFTGRPKSGKSNLIRLLTGLNVARQLVTKTGIDRSNLVLDTRL
jgi:energy-coupling factor transporter ATP-binding protein EcfA2